MNTITIKIIVLVSLFFRFVDGIGVQRVSSKPSPHPNNVCFDVFFSNEHEVFFCPKLKLIYIHIYKTGGTSIINYLKALCSLVNSNHSEAYFIRDTYRAIPGLRENKPTNLEELKRWQNEQGMIIFTAIRDPIDRFLSGYHEVCRRASSKTSNETRTDSSLTNFRLFFVHLQKSIGAGVDVNPHLARQSCFLLTHDMERVPVDLFLRTETLVADLPKLVDQASNLTIGHFLPLKNERNRTDPFYGNPAFTIFREDLHDWQMKTICSFYAIDFERFRFPKPLQCSKVDPEASRYG